VKLEKEALRLKNGKGRVEWVVGESMEKGEIDGSRC
jgi:hypothetical protein